MGRPKKDFYSGDVGLSIREKMKELDWEDRHNGEMGIVDNGNVHIPHINAPSDQEDEDWLERLYER